MRELLSAWTPEQFERTYAPGKWTARQVLIHLTQAELMIQPRVRLALTAADYVVQPFEQDDLVALEPSVDAHTALAAYRTLRQFALPLFESLTPAQLATHLPPSADGHARRAVVPRWHAGAGSDTGEHLRQLAEAVAD